MKYREEEDRSSEVSQDLSYSLSPLTPVSEPRDIYNADADVTYRLLPTPEPSINGAQNPAMSAATVVPVRGAIRQCHCLSLSCKTLSSPPSQHSQCVCWIENRGSESGPTVPKRAMWPAGTERHLSAGSTSVIGRPCPPRHLQSLRRGVHGLPGPANLKGEFSPVPGWSLESDPRCLKRPVKPGNASD